MSVWIITLAATAIGGALSLWHRVGRTKHASEEMLKQYAETLVESRRARQRKLSEAARESEGDSEAGEAEQG